MRVAVLTIACLIGALVLGVMLLPEGEVATLSTFEAGDAPQETAVWVVEGFGSDGEIYLRTGPNTTWLARLRANPAVELERGGETRPYLATVDEAEAVRERVNRAMAEKYGLADRLLSVVLDHSHAVTIRLVLDPTRKLAEEHGAPH